MRHGCSCSVAPSHELAVLGWVLARRNGLGNAARATSAAQYAGLGAKVGSIVPGIGNIVGGVVGAIAGAILGKKKPVRPSAEQIAQCNQVVNEYESAIAKYGDLPIGAALGEGNLKAVFVCFEMVRLGTTPDPRFLDGNWQLARDVAIEAVKKAFAAPPGTRVSLTTVGRRDIAGKAFRPFTLNYTNSEANTLESIARKTVEFHIGSCANYNARARCEEIFAMPYLRHAVVDLVDWAASTYVPQVEVPRELPPVAPPPPTVVRPPPPTVVRPPQPPLIKRQPTEPAPVTPRAPAQPEIPARTLPAPTPKVIEAGVLPGIAGAGWILPVALTAVGVVVAFATRPQRVYYARRPRRR